MSSKKERLGKEVQSSGDVKLRNLAKLNINVFATNSYQE